MLMDMHTSHDRRSRFGGRSLQARPGRRSDSTTGQKTRKKEMWSGGGDAGLTPLPPLRCWLAASHPCLHAATHRVSTGCPGLYSGSLLLSTDAHRVVGRWTVIDLWRDVKLPLLDPH
jgi:hypothetical protein